MNLSFLSMKVLGDVMKTHLDLSACSEEPIRYLGMAQDHGAIIALTPDLRISHVSENCASFLGLAPGELLGRLAGEVWSPANVDWLARASAAAATSRQGPIHQVWHPGRTKAIAWAHRHDGRILLEFEPLSPPPEGNFQERVQAAMGRIEACVSILEVVQQIVESVADLTGYDRAMCYRFLEDSSGEVVAECRKPHLEPFLGLRYPASDIPPQARALYLENLVRTLANVNGDPVPVLALPSETRPLDLSHAVLRSVSPYHLEYLKNMGVAGTTSFSILCEGQLWGLVNCHHSRPFVLAAHHRPALYQLATVMGAKVETLTRVARQKSLARIRSHAARLKPEPGRGSLIRQLLLGMPGTRGLLHADGVALAGSLVGSPGPESLMKAGKTPADAWIGQFAAWAAAKSQPVQSVDSFVDHPSGVANLSGAVQGSSAGALSLVLAKDPAVVLVFFRNEQIQQIRWGGDINHPVLRNELTGRISPRRSFAEFKQTIQGRCGPWTADDLAAIEQIRAVVRGYLADDESVRQAVEECRAELLNMIGSPTPLADSALEALPDGVLTMTSAGGASPRLRYANVGFVHLLGGEGIIEGDDTDVTKLLVRAGLQQDLLEQALQAPRLVEAGLSAHGRRNLLVRAELVLEVWDEPVSQRLLIMNFSDVTSSVRSHEELVAAKRRAEEASVAKSTFLANMSHEIRTPMNGILGTAQILALSTLTSDQQECVDLIQRSGDALMTILNDVLDFSKIEAGRLELEQFPFDLSGVVEDVANLMQSLAAKKHLQLRVEHSSILHRPVVGDPKRVRQVLLNLLGNAIKFTHQGEVGIEVTAEPVDAGRWTFHFTVRDTGIGIAQADLPKLFQRFYQVDGSTSRKYGGTGLGLAMSKQLIELMGGRIGVSSVPGQGSSFQFDLSLPVKEPLSPARAWSPVRKGPVEPKDASILLADDNEINRVVTRKLLAQLGYSLQVAADGREALEKWESGNYSLILMDCQMPEMDGFEATARIRERERDGRHTPVIALTGNVLTGDRQRCLEAGMDDYLAKPVHLEDLRLMLNRWTGAARAGMEDHDRVSR